MRIDGKVHCFFEQSGTFKNEFIKLGIPAEDYDIQNNFGETDHTDDLFQAIEEAYDGKPSLFDSITPDDLIMAFFPCIFFCATSQMGFGWHCHNYKKLSTKEKADAILQRSQNREEFFRLLVMLFAVTEIRRLRLIVENPWSIQHFLKANFIIPPTIIDQDRSMRGDFYQKPTAYWFWNCEPTRGFTIQQTPDDKIKTIMTSRGGAMAGLCSEERSMISPDYARNFICDFILGKVQKHSQLQLFE